MPAGFLSAVGRQKLSSLLVAYQLERKAGVDGIGRILPGTFLYNTYLRQEDNPHIGNVALLGQL